MRVTVDGTAELKKTATVYTSERGKMKISHAAIHAATVRILLHWCKKGDYPSANYKIPGRGDMTYRQAMLEDCAKLAWDAAKAVEATEPQDIGS